MRIGRRGRKRWAGRSRHETGISLTSMMDVLTTLLFFVLKSFVTGGEATTPPPGLSLPRSTAERAMQTSVVVAIDKGAILVGSERVTTVKDAMASDQMMIEPLANRLKAAAATASPQNQGGVKLVTIQGDQDIEFSVLQKVMYTLNQAGYGDIALAVLKKA